MMKKNAPEGGRNVMKELRSPPRGGAGAMRQQEEAQSAGTAGAVAAPAMPATPAAAAPWAPPAPASAAAATELAAVAAAVAMEFTNSIRQSAHCILHFEGCTLSPP